MCIGSNNLKFSIFSSQFILHLTLNSNEHFRICFWTCLRTILHFAYWFSVCEIFCLIVFHTLDLNDISLNSKNCGIQWSWKNKFVIVLISYQHFISIKSCSVRSSRMSMTTIVYELCFFKQLYHSMKFWYAHPEVSLNAAFPFALNQLQK